MRFLANIHSESTSNVLLYIVIMLANIDYISVLDYAIKAAVGAIVWFGVRILADYYSRRIFGKKPKHHPNASGNFGNPNSGISNNNGNSNNAK